MKTIIASLLILTSVSAMAQDTTTTTTSNDSSSATGGFGIHAGANFSDFDLGSTTANNAKSNKTGWLAGIHFEGFTFAQIFGIRLEGNYSNKGYDVGPFSVTHHYIQIPLLIKVGTPLGPVGVFAEAGPAASLHINSSVSSAAGTTTFDNNDKWDFSLIAGAGLNFKFDQMLLTIEGRYDYGLKNLNNSSGPDVKSRSIQALAGVTFLARP